MTHAGLQLCVSVPAGGTFGFHGGLVGGLAVTTQEKEAECREQEMAAQMLALNSDVSFINDSVFSRKASVILGYFVT